MLSDPAPTLAGVEPLTDLEERLLAFEVEWAGRSRDLKVQAIKAEFGVSDTLHYQRLRDLIEKPAALAAQPVLVKRLRRLRDTRRSARSARRLAG